MSDADDGFDKEAERKKLREKYERDQQKRESTERMSELLLQGATMTNKHCDDCGNPIFRYEGQTFCPACQGVAEGSNGAPDGVTDEAESANADGDERNAEAASADARTAEAEPDRSTADERSTEDRQDNARTADVDAGSAVDRTATQGAHGEGRDALTEAADPRTGERPPAAERTRATGTGAGDDIEAARESVRATLADLAARAERSNDAAHTKELLAATREAAETLRELNRLE